MMKKVSIKGFNLQEEHFLTTAEKRGLFGGCSDCEEPDGWWELGYKLCVMDEDCPSNYCDQSGSSYGRCYVWVTKPGGSYD